MLIVYPPFSGLSLNLLAMWKPLTGWNSICQNKIKINLQRVLGIVVAWNTLLLKHRLIIVDLSATMKHINWVCMWAWRWNIAQTGGSLTIGPQNSVHIWCQYGKKHSEHRSTLFASPDTNRFELREKIMAKKKKKKKTSPCSMWALNSEVSANVSSQAWQKALILADVGKYYWSPIQKLKVSFYHQLICRDLSPVEGKVSTVYPSVRLLLK